MKKKYWSKYRVFSSLCQRVRRTFRVKVNLIVYHDPKEFLYLTILNNNLTNICFCASKISRIYRISLLIQFECGKIRTRITPNTDTFYAVIIEAAKSTFTHFSREFVTSVTVLLGTYGIVSPKKTAVSHILIKQNKYI